LKPGRSNREMDLRQLRGLLDTGRGVTNTTVRGQRSCPVQNQNARYKWKNAPIGGVQQARCAKQAKSQGGGVERSLGQNRDNVQAWGGRRRWGKGGQSRAGLGGSVTARQGRMGKNPATGKAPTRPNAPKRRGPEEKREVRGSQPRSSPERPRGPTGTIRRDPNNGTAAAPQHGVGSKPGRVWEQGGPTSGKDAAEQVPGTEMSPAPAGVGGGPDARGKRSVKQGRPAQEGPKNGKGDSGGGGGGRSSGRRGRTPRAR